jgi:hypothetical protein
VGGMNAQSWVLILMFVALVVYMLSFALKGPKKE